VKRRTALGSLAAVSTAMHATRFVVLREREWFAREAWLYRALYDLEVEPRGGGRLWLPRLPGQRLDVVVSQRSRPEALVLARAALETLSSLHQTLPFSHADATAKNALVDAQGRVRFFDFETVHPASFSDRARLADDLATLAGSLALALGPSLDAALAGVLLQDHGGLRGELLEAASARDLASRARVPMSDARHVGWIAALCATPQPSSWGTSGVTRR
jgi:hypothetical protein